MNALDLDDDFADLVGAPSPDDVIVLIKSYFDESYDEKLLCVAGYSFTSRAARELDVEWKRMLYRFRLPYFRMSACNAHKAPFTHLTEEQCIEVATESIRLIGKYAAVGCAITIDQGAFYKIVTRKGVVSTPYELCAWLCLVAARSETEKIGEDGPMSFFFESGFKDQGLANRMMTNIFRSPDLKSYYRYKQHAFVDKKEVRPIQAADLLSWQWYKAATRAAKGITNPRGDLTALFKGTSHYAMHVTPDILQSLVDGINARAGTPVGNEIAGIAVSNPSSPALPKKGRRGRQ